MVTNIVLTAASAAVLEIAILFVGRWLRVRVSEGVTLGLLIGVIAIFSTNCIKPFNE